MPWITVVKKDEEPFTIGQVFIVSKTKEWPNLVDVYSLEGKPLYKLQKSYCKELFIEPMWTIATDKE